MVGMLRAGIPIVPIAPVNSAEAAAHLMIGTRAKHLLVSQDPSSLSLAKSAVQLISEASKMGRPRISEMPTYSDVFLEGSPMRRLPDRNFDLFSPAIYVHSSGSCNQLSPSSNVSNITHPGSTSLPKPVIWTHAVLLQAAASQCKNEIVLI